MGFNISLRRVVDWRVISLGLALMVLGPNLLWSLWSRYRYHPPDVAIPEWAFGLVWYGLAAFALGWLMVGAGWRPGNSIVWGVALAATAYALFGLAWTIVFDLEMNDAALGEILEPQKLVAILQQALIWPLTVAQVLGLFGLTLG